MEEYLYVNHAFNREAMRGIRVSNREFDRCSFNDCDFSDSEFIDCIFTECVFIDSNLSMSSLSGTTLQQASFERCKLLGIRFDACNPILFSPNFDNCTLDYSWFAGLNMPQVRFTGCSLKGVNFSDSKLKSADFSASNLDAAIFENTDLSGADMSSALNFNINPERNRLASAHFSMQNLEQLLAQYEIKIV